MDNLPKRVLSVLSSFNEYLTWKGAVCLFKIKVGSDGWLHIPLIHFQVKPDLRQTLHIYLPKHKLALFLFSIFQLFSPTKLNYALQGWGAGACRFWLLGAGAGWGKNQEPEPKELKRKTRCRSRLKKWGAWASWKKNEEPELTEKKRGAGAEKKFAGSPALNFQEFPCTFPLCG